MGSATPEGAAINIEEGDDVGYDDDEDERTERVEFDARLVRGTDDAQLLEYTDGNGNIAEDWFPRSQVADLDVHADNMCSLSIPEWLAVDRGVV